MKKSKKIVAVLVLLGVLYLVSYLFKPLILFGLGANSNINLVDSTFVSSDGSKSLTFYFDNKVDYVYLNDTSLLTDNCTYLLTAGLIEVSNKENQYNFLVLSEDSLFSSSFKTYFERFIA